MKMNICKRMRSRRNRKYRTVQVLVLIAMLMYLLIPLSTFGVGSHRMKIYLFGNVGRRISYHLTRSRNVSRTAEPENNLIIPAESHRGEHREKSRVAQNDERQGMLATSADPSWKRFLEGISVDAMYPRSPSYMRDFSLYMNRATIVNVTAFNRGSQFKLLMRFEDGNEVVAKPMRHPRDFYWAYNRSQPFWLDEERHTAEIAAFHLDSILGFRKVIPCVGRKVNFTAEILHNTEDPNILGTLKKIEANNCFFGNCKPWFCNEQHAICDHDGFMELSMCFRIPGGFRFFNNLWSQGISEAKVWKKKNICKDALKKPDNLKGRFFLDIMESALFDHLIVNYDRHSHVKHDTGNNLEQSSVVILDNGKGFGNPFKDDSTFLAPIYQCCRFRNSTYQHLLSLSNRLGDLMKASLSTDPLAPVLTDPFFPALDRRLNQFYYVMEKCLGAYRPEVVLVEKLSPP